MIGIWFPVVLALVAGFVAGFVLGRLRSDHEWFTVFHDGYEAAVNDYKAPPLIVCVPSYADAELARDGDCEE